MGWPRHSPHLGMQTTAWSQWWCLSVTRYRTWDYRNVGPFVQKPGRKLFFFLLWSPGLSTFLLILPWARRHSLGHADCSIPGPLHIWPSPLLCLDSDPHWAKGSSEGLSWGLKPLTNASHQLSLSKHKFKDKLLRIWGMQREGLKSQGRACFCQRGLAASFAHQPLAASVPEMRQTWGSYHFQALMWAPSPAACPLTCVTQLQLLEIRHPRYTTSAGWGPPFLGSWVLCLQMETLRSVPGVPDIQPLFPAAILRCSSPKTKIKSWGWWLPCGAFSFAGTAPAHRDHRVTGTCPLSVAALSEWHGANSIYFFSKFFPDELNSPIFQQDRLIVKATYVT